MSVVVSVSDVQRRMMELVDGFNKSNGNDVVVEINWQYWLTNAVYTERCGDEYTIVSKDGLVLKVLDRGEKVVVKLDSMHAAMCECTCGE